MRVAAGILFKGAGETAGCHQRTGDCHQVRFHQHTTTACLVGQRTDIFSAANTDIIVDAQEMTRFAGDKQAGIGLFNGICRCESICQSRRSAKGGISGQFFHHFGKFQHLEGFLIHIGEFTTAFLNQVQDEAAL
ncbi:hypothetical protein SDC9_101558 [bioreactor metagenome]|uniref:Uncharacterized protein n=1 Tax=bioreactor metagenome TaxID=1076179 RepID=A0A645APT8_9ZZZZ